jgi:hypothetical protein
MAEETEAPLVDAETEEEEELRRVAKHDTLLVWIYSESIYCTWKRKAALRVAVVLKYTKIR